MRPTEAAGLIVLFAGLAVLFVLSFAAARVFLAAWLAL